MTGQGRARHVGRAFPALLLLLALLAALPAGCAGQEPPRRLSDGYRNYYEIFVRSFYDSDGDGLGDLDGVREKLDYIVDDLGADGLWLMPIMPSPTYHKYDVMDYRSIDPEYGTLEDFDALVAEAHARDVRILLDLVVNHTSNRHPWFKEAVSALWNDEESPYIDYYNFSPEDPGQGWNKITDKYYYECRFVAEMPDLNLDNPEVREEILSIAQFWLDRGADGFRLDAVTSFYTGHKEKNIEFLRWLNDGIKAIRPDAYLVGEAWTDGVTITDYYGSGLDSFFNFPYSQATGRLVAALNARTGRNLAGSLAEWNRTIQAARPGARDALFLSNHDHARSAGILMRDIRRQKMAAALYLLAPGNPFVYYGEELGMTGSGKDENARLPMAWSTTDPAGIPLPPPNATQTVEGIDGADRQLRDRNSLLQYYRRIFTIKARYPEIARGIPEARDGGLQEVAILAMTWQGRTVCVVHNLAEEAVSVDLALAGLQGATLGDSLAVAGGKPRMARDRLSMPPLSTAILVAAEGAGE